MIIGLMLGLLTVFLAIGMPISHAMGLSAVLALALEGDIPLLLLAQRFYDALDSFPLLAVPLFILAGELMNVAGITERLVACPGPWSATSAGGLAQASIVANMFMSALSGSALADLAAIGSMMIPAMKREGYRPEFAAAVTACAAMMAPDHPAQHHRRDLRLGHRRLDRRPLPGRRHPRRAGRAGHDGGHLVPGAAGRRPPVAAGHPGRGRPGHGPALPALLMPLIIIGGILSGAFTPTEAGAVAALYALLFGLVARRHTSRVALRATSPAPPRSPPGALITLGGRRPVQLDPQPGRRGGLALRALLSVTDSPALAMLILMVFFFLVGTFLEPVPALIIIVPVMAPIIAHLGFDPVHFGIITIMMLVSGR